MKKLIYLAASLAALLFAGSCQRESLEPEIEGTTVSYTVQLPDAMTTKAGATYSGEVNKLVYEVHRIKEDETTYKLYQKTVDITNGVADLEIEFVKGQNFKVLFWAQKEGVYDTGDLTAVKVPNSLTSNSNDYEAFYGTDDVTNGNVSATGGKVNLTRAVSLLNIGTSQASLSVGEATVALSQSDVTVKGLHNTLNIMTGDVTNEVSNHAYASAGVPSGTLTVGTENYVYVAKNYVGFADADKSTVDVDFTITLTDGSEVKHSIPSVPLKRNYKTNIVGDLISATAKYTVSLTNDWATEEHDIVLVSNASDLQGAINNAVDGEETEIKLGGDIDLNDLAALLSPFSTKAASDPVSITVPVGKTITLDLNGCTLSQTAEQTGAHSMIENKGNLTIVDSKGTGKIAYGDTGNGGNYVSNTIANSGRLVIESGVIENNSSATVAANGYPHPIDNSGELTINGGTLTNNANYSSMRIWCTTDDDTSVTINGGTFNGSIDFQTPSAAANKGTLTINDGTFNADSYTNCAVRLLGFGADVDEMFGYITGGTFNGLIKINKYGSVQELNSQVFYITGGQFSADPTTFVVDGYPVIAPETEGGYYTIGQFNPVAKIGDVEYGSLRAAIAAAQENETITLIKDINQVDGVIITDKKLTIDLNDKTFTVSEGANTNNRNFKINGSSIVTIKNGTMVAAGDYSSGAYGTVRTEGTANVTLEDVKLYNYRGNGLNVKALSGTTVTINNTEIYSEYGGGVEAAGGTVELTNVKVEQKGMYTAPYNSMAISVNGGGTATVNSGTYSTECITAEEANNQGTSHGPWCAGVLNSGGTLIINGGTFSNDNFGDNTLATAARGLLLADTGANIEINGGTFNAVKKIIDIQNNLGDASKNPKATLKGGTYSSNPLTWDGLISAPKGYTVKEVDGFWTVVFNPVAKIGETGYATLIDAVEAVQDGETITLVADETFTATNYYNNGGWKDGLGYSGDKSFTIDLGGYTIKQDGSLNDYLIWIKNDGAKANTITLKNGTMDAGTTAYSAFATASSNKQTITVNLEHINLVNNNSNGAVVKARGGSVLNVNAGTVITGKNSYTGIEAAGTNTVVNVYDGAEIYQKGTSSYVGAIAGASQNATLNIYGGKGKSAKCGIIVMSTGATINVSGGEWTANGDGTVAGGNQGVLVSQNNRNETGWACKSILNVTGGTFEGGYDCWGMGPGQEPDDAQINIKGGNFNADPAQYVANDYKAVGNNGNWNVVVDPAAKIGTTEYASLSEAFEVGGNITLLRDVKVTETLVLAEGKTATLDLNGYNITVPEATQHIYAINNKGNLTLKDSKGTGSVKARGIYNGYNGSNSDETVEGATMTVESGNFYALDSNGGAAIFNCAKAIINGGVFDGQVAAFNGRKCAETTINGGVFRSVNNYAIQQNNGGELTINDATVNRGFGAVGCFGGKVTIAEGEFLPTGMAGKTCHVVYVAAGADVTINGGTYKMNYPENAVPDSGSAVASYYNGTLAINGGTFTAHFDNVSPVELSSGSTIKGGTYYNHAGVASQHSYITNYVAEGYELNANGEVVKM